MTRANGRSHLLANAPHEAVVTLQEKVTPS
jgi:hypothetical protein